MIERYVFGPSLDALYTLLEMKSAIVQQRDLSASLKTNALVACSEISRVVSEISGVR
jgi:hypothetical protein